MSGFALWGHDVGGYENGNFSAVSPENLFMRWTQFGCFSPIMQMYRQGAQVNRDDPADLRQYPWGYGHQGWITSASSLACTPNCFPTSTPTPSWQKRAVYR